MPELTLAGVTQDGCEMTVTLGTKCSKNIYSTNGETETPQKYIGGWGVSVDGWMDGCMDGCMDGWMDRRINEYIMNEMDLFDRFIR
jgi:hypothetical protein